MVGRHRRQELAVAGYKVVGLERGQTRDTVPEFQSPEFTTSCVSMCAKLDAGQHPGARDISQPKHAEGTPGASLGILSSRHRLRRLDGALERSNLPIQANDFQLATLTQERYGKNFLDADLTIQDWGVTYNELEPHYDRFEYLLGTSGKAGNIKGRFRREGIRMITALARLSDAAAEGALPRRLFRKAAASMAITPSPNPHRT